MLEEQQMKGREHLAHRDAENVEWEDEHRYDHDEHNPPEEES